MKYIKNWNKVTYKRGRSTQEETKGEAKHAKESEHCLNQTSTSNSYTAHWKRNVKTSSKKAGPEITPKPSPIYITDDANISSLIQLLEQIAKQQYEIKALADNQVKVQPKTSECYKTIIKALAEKNMQFHTYKLKDEISYRVVLKICTTPSTLKIKKPKFMK
jgi:hypothetical protein